MTNIETIRTALLGIVSKTEREEAIAALDEVENVLDQSDTALDETMELLQCSYPESVDGYEWKIMSNALSAIRKLRKDNINGNT